MGEWRYIPLQVNDAYTNMAIDEAILLGISKGISPNTFRLYRWYPSAISLGYFQNLESEVDLEACKEMGVDVVRRMTGGGNVYHDYEGEITYSIAFKEGEINIPRDVVESYKYIEKGIVISLKKMGIEARMSGINDIIVMGKKISGNAQTRRYGVVLQHGTILLDVNVDKMFTLLKVSSEKLRDKMIKSVRERVTSLRHIIGKKPSFDEVERLLKEGFEEALGVKFSNGELNDFERGMLPKLIDKYKSKEWTFRR
ncbi:MAG: lipoate--protein ligase family protein [Candidatus Asgardarchaeia archaeon]